MARRHLLVDISWDDESGLKDDRAAALLQQSLGGVMHTMQVTGFQDPTIDAEAVK
jgi:hypothetical protein